MDIKQEYHMRLTTEKDFDEIEEFVKTLCTKYIISSEVGHYHCYIDTAISRKDLRLKINKLGLKGNGQFSLAEARNSKQLKKYILKDGFYRYAEFEDSYIEKLKICSHKKGMSKYSEELAKLEEEFLTDKKVKVERFMEKVIDLQISYNMKVRRQQHELYMRYMIFRKHPFSKQQYVKYLCYDQTHNGY